MFRSEPLCVCGRQLLELLHGLFERLPAGDEPKLWLAQHELAVGDAHLRRKGEVLEQGLQVSSLATF
jgi:hypothetical protein